MFFFEYLKIKQRGEAAYKERTVVLWPKRPESVERIEEALVDVFQGKLKVVVQPGNALLRADARFHGSFKGFAKTGNVGNGQLHTRRHRVAAELGKVVAAGFEGSVKVKAFHATGGAYRRFIVLGGE